MIEVVSSDSANENSESVALANLKLASSDTELVEQLTALPDTFSAIERKFYYIYTNEIEVPVHLSIEMQQRIATEIKQKLPASKKVTQAGSARMNQETEEPSFDDSPKSELPTWLVRGLIDYGSIDHWSVFVPATLGLIDSAEMAAKVQGILAAKSIAKKYKTKLESTGLLPVYREAISSCLHFLPPSTTAEETMEIQGPAVMALVELATKPEHLHSVMRDGPLRAFKFSQQNVALIIYLLDLTARVGEQLKERSIAHLKELIHIFMAVMADPFIDASPQLVEAATTMLQSVVLRFCVPRLANYRYDVLYAFAKARAVDGPIFDEFVSKAGITAEELAKIRTTLKETLELRQEIITAPGSLP